MRDLIDKYGVNPLLFSIITLNLALSTPSLWIPYYNVDETTNILFGRLIMEGQLGLHDFLGSAYFLTHYLYALVYNIFPHHTLMAMHIVHALWKSGMIVGLYFAGKAFHNKETGLCAALFYTLCSYSFMSKDFHTPSAESFSLLPAAWAAYFLFTQSAEAGSARVRRLILAGILTAIVALFKAPAGVLLVAGNVYILLQRRRPFASCALYTLAFAAIFLFPILCASDLSSGFASFWTHMRATNATYIEFYRDFSLLYWGIKFALRTCLLLAAWLIPTISCVFAVRAFLEARRTNKALADKLVFLFLWLFLNWLTVAIGKRVFYHYFVFVLAPFSLIAGYGFNRWLETLAAAGKRRKGLIRCAVLLLFVPLAVFSVEGALNYSTSKPPHLDKVTAYVEHNTAPGDHIYAWGAIPQLYTLSNRLPASTYFWTDMLAGTIPGSPAMEYVQATGASLKVGELLQKDFTAQPLQENPPNKDYGLDDLNAIRDSELFTVRELLGLIKDPNWRRVMTDFFRTPPELFIDSSPTNYRGFAYYPIERYELLKRFLHDNYTPETTVADYVIYRLMR